MELAEVSINGVKLDVYYQKHDSVIKIISIETPRDVVNIIPVLSGEVMENIKFKVKKSLEKK